MEIAKAELVILKEVADLAQQDALNELQDSDLLLIGGGNGTVIFP